MALTAVIVYVPSNAAFVRPVMMIGSPITKLGAEDVVIVAEADTADAGEREQIAGAIRQVVTRGSAVALRNVYITGPHWIAKTSSGKTARGANREKYLQEIEDL